ncbi:MAG: DUF3899 domain-containing protein [Agathobacter sp.]|nr:DUF3899 domain-containing protein [Agathobacter sp.]
MKNMKYYVQAGVGLLLAFVIMVYRGLFSKPELSDKVMAIGDGFTVVAVLYLGFGAIMWVSTMGFFDIFAYAAKKAAHAIVPGVIQDDVGRYYEYKVEKETKRKGFLENFTLKLGAIFLVLSVVFLIIWYQVV